jgi:hypothetical protein
MLLNWFHRRAAAREEAVRLAALHGPAARQRCEQLIERRSDDARKVRFLRMVLKRLPKSA